MRKHLIQACAETLWLKFLHVPWRSTTSSSTSRTAKSLLNLTRFKPLSPELEKISIKHQYLSWLANIVWKITQQIFFLTFTSLYRWNRGLPHGNTREIWVQNLDFTTKLHVTQTKHKETNLKDSETTKHIQRDVWKNVTWFNTGIRRFGAWDPFAIGGPNFLELYEQVSERLFRLHFIFSDPVYFHISLCAGPCAFPDKSGAGSPCTWCDM